MKTYKVILHIRAETDTDAEELIQEYSGKETDIEIKYINVVYIE